LDFDNSVKYFWHHKRGWGGRGWTT